MMSLLHNKGFASFKLWLQKDLKSTHYSLFALAILLIATLLTVVVYITYPYPSLNADTPGYLEAARQIQIYGLSFQSIHAMRLPVYPLFMLLIFAIAGQGNLMAVSIVQGALFVLAALEVYILLALLLRRSWLAALVSLFVAANPVLLLYSKQIMTEGPSLWLLTTLILCSVFFFQNIQKPRWFLFWAMLGFMILLIFTRPEWILLPIVLNALLLFKTWRTSIFRRIIPRMIISLLVFYALVGGYIITNYFVHGYMGLSWIENMNYLGKVMQYRMYREAPPEYQYITDRIIQYIEVEHRGRSPYQLLGSTLPELRENNNHLAGEYARSIIYRHPLEFIGYTIPYVPISLTYFYVPPSDPAHPTLHHMLLSLTAIHKGIYHQNYLFLFYAAFWLLLLCWKRTRSHRLVQGMSFISVIVLYALVITTAGGYFETDYMRVHIVFDQLIYVVTWGTPAALLLFLAQYLRRKRRIAAVSQ